MPKRKSLDLSKIDDRLLDGLRFCSKVYDLFDQVRSEPDGLGKIRLLATKREKRLLEELLPIAKYIQDKYNVGNRLKVRWLSGSQPYDAIIWTPMVMVKNTNVPRKTFLEVTTAVHKNAHIARKMLHEKGGSFGVKGISISKTGKPESRPYVYTNDEGTIDLADQIIERIASKAAKSYPDDTVLIVNCNPDMLILEDEWNEAVQRVKATELHKTFMEVILIEPRGRHFSTLWGGRKNSRAKRDKKTEKLR